MIATLHLLSLLITLNKRIPMLQNVKRKSRGSSATARNTNKRLRRGNNATQSELLSHSTTQLIQNRTTRSTIQQQTLSSTTRSIPNRTTQSTLCATDAAINQGEDDRLLTKNDIPAIVDAMIRSLPLPSNQETTPSFPSNQPASQQQSQQLIQRDTQPLPEQQQQPNQQQQSSLIPGQPL